jgi:hypothetical protein
VLFLNYDMAPSQTVQWILFSNVEKRKRGRWRPDVVLFLPPLFNRELIARQSHAEWLATIASRNQTVPNVEADTTRFLDKISALLGDQSDFTADQGWIHHTSEPTALDAHTVVFIARLLDTGRDWIIPEKVMAYAKPKLESATWRDLLRGEPKVTMHSLYIKNGGKD